MKNFIALFVISLILVMSCKQPTDSSSDTSTTTPTVTTETKYVKNSRWNVVRTAPVAVTASRISKSDIATVDDLKSWVADHNSSTTTDQYFLLDSDVPASSGPTAYVWMVDPNTYERKTICGVLYDGIAVDRALVDGRYDAWSADAKSVNGVLYVDNEPPAYTPPAADTRTDYEKYAIYAIVKETKKIVIDPNSNFKYETHCEDYDPSWMLSGKDQYFITRIRSFQNDVDDHNYKDKNTTWYVLSGAIYVEPTE